MREKLFTYADTKAQKNELGPASGFYSSDSWEDDYALCGGSSATGKSAYATKYNNVYGGRTNLTGLFAGTMWLRRLCLQS